MALTRQEGSEGNPANHLRPVLCQLDPGIRRDERRSLPRDPIPQHLQGHLGRGHLDFLAADVAEPFNPMVHGLV